MKEKRTKYVDYIINEIDLIRDILLLIALVEVEQIPQDTLSNLAGVIIEKMDQIEKAYVDLKEPETE